MRLKTSSSGAVNDTRRESSQRTEKKKKSRRREPYSVYIYRVLKETYPDAGISSKAMSIMNSFVGDIVERLAVESARLVRYNNRATITPRDIKGAARLIFPVELAKEAIARSSQVLNKYTCSK